MTTTTTLAKVCDTCQKRIDGRNRAANGIQCRGCAESAMVEQARLDLEAQSAARKAAAEERRAARLLDPELVNTITELALEVSRLQERVIDNATRVAERATQLAEAADDVTRMGGMYGINSQVTLDTMMTQAALEANVRTLGRLLGLLGIADQLTVIVDKPWTFFTTHTTA